MDAETLLQEKREKIAEEGLAILDKHGFFSLSPALARQFSGDLSGKRQTGLTQRHLDQITLEFALVFIAHGYGQVQTNEFLNRLRKQIVEALESLGYAKPDWLCQDSQSRWGCYQLWVEVASLGGATAKEIAETREQCQIKHSGDYEG